MSPIALAVGHVTLDRYGDALLPGGGVWYAARTWRALGARARIATVIGDDFGADLGQGLEIHSRRAGRTTVFDNVYPEGGPRQQVVESQAPPVRPSDLPPAWRRADVLFIAPVLGEAEVSDWLAAVDAPLRAAGLQGWLKRAANGPLPRAVIHGPGAVDPARFAGLDVACLSEEDLAGDDAWLSRLTSVVPLVAFTYGPRGCDLIRRGRTTAVPAHPAPELDPTGAGDTFAAAFLLALSQGADPVDAARTGGRAAAAVVQHRAAAPDEALRAAVDSSVHRRGRPDSSPPVGESAASTCKDRRHRPDGGPRRP